mmetsp:Transcript_8808/g.15501  ORF Transcript_8808/g.15501 Transcript_8808/m.15501 type:complete len:976 (+) Transcript_8808:58-2985(+)
MAPYTPYVTTETPWQPKQYHQASVVKLINGLPRYGYTRDINAVLSDGLKKDDYVWGIVMSPCCLLLFLLVWCLLLIFFKFYSDSWVSGCLERPPVTSRQIPSTRRQHVNCYNSEELDDDTSSTSGSSGSRGSDCSGLSIDSSIFWTNPTGCEELTMAVIAREQKRDELLHKSQKKRPQNYSTTTNGLLSLITMLDHHCREQQGDSFPRFRVYIPPSLRLPLLRTYHDCLVYPNDVSNAHSMIYEFFTWKDIRRDVFKYVKRHRQCMGRGDNAAMVRFGSDDEDSLDENTPITLDVIARQQSEDTHLACMMGRAPSVFSTATNGSIQLITARGKDNKYRIVIPTSLQAKVLMTYHDCLVNPTQENNFKKVLYVHFTWNGIHKDVENYVLNEGLTEEMRARRFHRRKTDGYDVHTGKEMNQNGSDGSFDNVEEEEPSSGSRPIGLDEIATEQKKDRELRQLKKEEPFVFSTVRYGNTLLTTAQNFRDNKYRIVIPRRLQGRMLMTYQECLLNPTPDRNFDTLLYNHFTWNGIHDDVDYFVKNGGHLPDKEHDDEDDDCRALIPLVKMCKGEKEELRSHRQDMEYLEWVGRNEKFELQTKTIRIVFLISGFFMIMSSIMFFEQGVNRVFKSLNDAQRGLQHTENVAYSALSVTGDYLEIQPNIQDTAKAIGTYNTSQWCTPMRPQASLSEFVLQVRNSTYEIGIQLRDTAIRVESEVKGIEHDLEQLVDIVQNVDATLEDFKTYIEVAKVLVIFLDIIVVSLMTACVLAWMGEQHFLPTCVRKTVIIPLFVTLLILFWIISTAVLLGAMVGADFCSNPDESAMALIMGFQGQLSPLIFMLMMYYITGCLPERWPPKLEILSSSVSTIGGFLHSQLSAVAKATTKQPGLTELCGGRVNFSKLVAVLELTDTAVHGMYDVLIGVRDMSGCHNFNSVYTTLVYDALCNGGAAGLSWVFFTSLSMAVFSMFMVTLRVAIHPH